MNEIDSKKTDDLLCELTQRFFDIPFENSHYQNKTFVAQAQQTPGRAYRAIGLRMFSKINAINELKYSRKLENVDIEEKQHAIKTSSNEFDVKRAKIEIQKILSTRGYTDKLLNDAIAELDYLYSELQQFPEYTRAQFENEEREHFQLKLDAKIQAGDRGALLSRASMDIGDKFHGLLRSRSSGIDIK